MDVRGRLAGAAERESTDLAAAPDGVLHRTALDAPDRVVLHKYTDHAQIASVFTVASPLERGSSGALASHAAQAID